MANSGFREYIDCFLHPYRFHSEHYRKRKWVHFSAGIKKRQAD